MEWEKVRKWMLILVLAVDLFLAGNLIRQTVNRHQIRNQAAQDAVAIAQNRGIEISLEEVLRMPEELTAYRGRRGSQAEAQAAAGLLGAGMEMESPGGGVTIYRGGGGELSFRRGGMTELQLDWPEDRPLEDCSQLLEQAGFPLEGSQVNEQPGMVELTQSQQGYLVFNSRLVCTLSGGRLQVRGRWLLQEEMTVSGQGMDRAQMVLALCAVLEEQGGTPLYGLRAGYCLQSQDAQSLILEPVWEAETGEGRLIISCLTGKQLNF